MEEGTGMKVTVDLDKCEYFGQCVIAAPDVFSLATPTELVYEESPSEDHFDEVEEAADVCPAQAILVQRGN